MHLQHIVVSMGVVYGDICRYARCKTENKKIDEIELKKELGNMILSTIGWCDGLGYNPEKCIRLAKEAQVSYSKH